MVRIVETSEEDGFIIVLVSRSEFHENPELIQMLRVHSSLNLRNEWTRYLKEKTRPGFKGDILPSIYDYPKWLMVEYPEKVFEHEYMVFNLDDTNHTSYGW